MMSNFDRTYRVQNADPSQNASSNLLLPESALNELMANNCHLPYTFRVSNCDNTQITHVGVQEFSSTDGMAVVPTTILQRLSHPSTIRVQYIKLPRAQTLQLQPHNLSFLQHNKKLYYIRKQLATLTCISLNDVIHVVIENISYKLNVTKIIPSTHKAVSMLQSQDSVGINLTKPLVNDMDNDVNDPSDTATDDDNEYEYDLVDVDNNHTIDGADNNNNTLGNGNDNDNESNAGFSDGSGGDGWADTDGDEYSDFEYDGQDKIPIKQFTPSPDIEDDMELVPNSMSTDNGKSRELKPVKTRIDRRAWICEFCHAINNLLDSMKRNYGCIQCDGKYKPGQTIIESANPDKARKENPTFTVWLCQCSGVNNMDQQHCALCLGKKPKEGLITFITEEQPTDHHELHQKPVYEKKPIYDKPEEASNDKPGFTAWRCQCTCINSIARNKCWLCNAAPPQEGLVTFKTNERPHGPHRKVEIAANKVYRHRYANVRDMQSMGDIKRINRYPTISKKYEINKRLIDVFGTPYRNSLIVNKTGRIIAKNKWNIHNDVGHGQLKISAKRSINLKLKIFVNSEIVPSSIAINERNGYIACIVGRYIFVLRPKGCNDFITVAVRMLVSIKEKVVVGRNRRIRFVGNNIYIFHPESYKIINYELNEKKAKIVHKQELCDSYLKEAAVLDIAVSDELLIVLFDRWLGVYKIKPFLKWYHAVAYSQHDKISANSIEMSTYDDWEDAFVCNNDEMEEEEKRGVEDKIFATKMHYKASIKNYCFINCQHCIIAVHPTNPTFDFLFVAKNVKDGSSFCNSRKYGTFWINNECDMICQSATYNYANSEVIFSLEKLFKWDKYRMIAIDNNDEKQSQIKNIKKLNKVVYDEGYGISGRLLVNCTISFQSESIFYQLFNQNELLPLKQEFEKNDYFLMPGTNLKPFNLIVYVFEMLYGCDLINLLIQSPDFNSVYALPGNQPKAEIIQLPHQKKALPILEEVVKEEKVDIDLEHDVEGDDDKNMKVIKAIKAIGIVKAENDEDLVFVDMEIEAEGV